MAIVRQDGGQGTGGDYWLLVVLLALVFFLLYLDWRGAPQPFHWLLVLFHLALSAGVVTLAWTHPQDFRFAGATIGVSFSLARVGPVLSVGFTILAILWVARDLKTRSSRPLVPWRWTRATKIRLIFLFAAVPVEVALFRTSGRQSVQNVFWQWFVINRMLASSRASDGRHLLDGVGLDSLAGLDRQRHAHPAGDTQCRKTSFVPARAWLAAQLVHQGRDHTCPARANGVIELHKSGRHRQPEVVYA